MKKIFAFLLFLTFIIAASTPLQVFTVLAWKGKYWNLVSRLHYSVVTVAVLMAVYSLYTMKNL